MIMKYLQTYLPCSHRCIMGASKTGQVLCGRFTEQLNDDTSGPSLGEGAAGAEDMSGDHRSTL